MKIASNNVSDWPDLAGFLQPVNLQIHKDAWALLHMVVQDQRKDTNPQRMHRRRLTLRVFVDILFMQTRSDDKNAFDLFDALEAVKWDTPLEVNSEFLRHHAAWRKEHAYVASGTIPVSFESMSRMKQFEAKLGERHA